jgi:hypothetical protein
VALAAPAHAQISEARIQELIKQASATVAREMRRFRFDAGDRPGAAS